MASKFRPGQPVPKRAQLPRASRYELLFKIAAGGMATVYVGRLRGPAGFWRLVAVKRAHAHLLEESGFTRMLVAEARLASRIHHPNVASVQDIEELDGELLLVLDYVEGPSLNVLLAEAESAGRALSIPDVVRIVLDACGGLQAAHDLPDDSGQPLGLVHRDVSPQNLLVGVDGIARLVDFGIAKCSKPMGAMDATATGSLKGKTPYMAPEYVDSGHIDARGDVFALGIVAWEALTSKRLFRRDNEIETLRAVSECDVRAPSALVPTIPPALDEVVLRSLARDPERRFSSARAFASALERAANDAGLLGSHAGVADTVRLLLGDALEQRRAMIRELVQASGIELDASERLTSPLIGKGDGVPASPASGRPTVPLIGSGDRASATLTSPMHESTPAAAIAEHVEEKPESRGTSPATFVRGNQRPGGGRGATRRLPLVVALLVVLGAVAIVGNLTRSESNPSAAAKPSAVPAVEVPSGVEPTAAASAKLQAPTANGSGVEPTAVASAKLQAPPASATSSASAAPASDLDFVRAGAKVHPHAPSRAPATALGAPPASSRQKAPPNPYDKPTGAP